MAELSFTWLGHATFKIQTPGGKTVIVDPWIQGNPACPEPLKQVDRVDLMLITHGHFDHIADAVDLGKARQPQIVSVFETAVWLESKGVGNLAGMNKGGTQPIAGLKVTMVHADHSCGILDDGKIIYGGEPCGYVIEFENGFKLYHAGDTNVFGDMRIIGELYQPDLVMLPVGDFYTMGVREAVYACRLLGTKAVVPMHFGTFPVLTGNPAALREATRDLGLEVLALKPGETLPAARVPTGGARR